MDDKEIKLKMENEEWMHPWDIQSIIDMIDTVSVNACYGRISDFSYIENVPYIERKNPVVYLID